MGCRDKIEQIPWLLDRFTIPTEKPPLVGELQCQLLRIEGFCVVSAAASHGPYSRFSRPRLLFLHSSSSSVIIMRLSGPRSGPTTYKI
jgi:hypothetical protein